MKKTIITGVALGAFALSTSFMIQPANASAAYRTVKTKSYAGTAPAYHAKTATKSVYLWNSTLTKKLHNLKNYPKTTWYVQKSVKLTNGKKTGIFYYVQNKSHSASGYVWRSYLTKGAYQSTSKVSYSTSEKVAQTLKAFPGTVTGDAELAKIAALKVNSRSYGDDYRDALPSADQSHFAFFSISDTSNPTLMAEVKAGKLTYTDYVTQVVNKAITSDNQSLSGNRNTLWIQYRQIMAGKTTTDFSGWHILVQPAKFTDKATNNILVFLLQPTA